MNPNTFCHKLCCNLGPCLKTVRWHEAKCIHLGPSVELEHVNTPHVGSNFVLVRTDLLGGELFKGKHVYVGSSVIKTSDGSDLKITMTHMFVLASLLLIKYL